MFWRLLIWRRSEAIWALSAVPKVPKILLVLSSLCFMFKVAAFDLIRGAGDEGDAGAGAGAGVDMGGNVGALGRGRDNFLGRGGAGSFLEASFVGTGLGGMSGPAFWRTLDDADPAEVVAVALRGSE